MASKSGVKLDIVALCQLAVAAKGFRDEVIEYLDEIEKNVANLHGGDIDGLDGGQGEAISNSLDSVKKMCGEIRKLTNQIYVIADKKADQVSEQYKDHGGNDQYTAIKNQEAAITKG